MPSIPAGSNGNPGGASEKEQDRSENANLGSAYEEDEWTHAMSGDFEESRESPESAIEPSAGDVPIRDDQPLPPLKAMVANIPEETRNALEEHLRGKFIRVQRVDPDALK